MVDKYKQDESKGNRFIRKFGDRLSIECVVKDLNILSKENTTALDKIEKLEAENERLKEREKKYLSMIENGLGFEDLERDIGDV